MSIDDLPSCPVCLNAYGTTAQVHRVNWDYRVECEICGVFDVRRETFDDFLDPRTAAGRKLSTAQRARISHRLLAAAIARPSTPSKLTSDFLEQYIEEGCPGPNPGQQAINAIAFIGDAISESGARIASLPKGFFALIGAPSPVLAGELLHELKVRGLLSGAEINATNAPYLLLNTNLTLTGWERYEEEKRGTVVGNYGFLAMKFGEPELETLIRNVVKPKLKADLNLELVDMRDVARAGIIDNIMRAQIRDAAFLIVDLTHDNYGAYWEAGYGEGLGKPVIYICETAKFDRAKTHFDTNHCTTVPWATSQGDEFVRQLIATLRRSLNLFS